MTGKWHGTYMDYLIMQSTVDPKSLGIMILVNNKKVLILISKHIFECQLTCQ